MTDLRRDHEKLTLLYHAVRKRQSTEEVVSLHNDSIQEILNVETLPDVNERAEILIRWTGDQTMGASPGRRADTDPQNLRALLGVATNQDVVYILTNLEKRSFIERTGTEWNHRLTFKGWDKFEELRRGLTESHRAFMAMPFNDEQLNEVFKRCFQPAVAETGFTLFRLDEDPKAGIIDNNMIVAIRNSRFVVAEITGLNTGAIWEAGFAEGEGKPVIYTCRDDQWDAAHFDTNHRQSVIWNPEDLVKVSRDLKACIRATFPESALQEDREK